MVALINFLGQGIYTPGEVAIYTREHPLTVQRWLMGTSSSEPVVPRQFKDDDRFVSFLDFIQTLAIATIRRQYKVSLQLIREAVRESQVKHGIDYPFARQHKTFLFERVEKGRRAPISDDDSEIKKRYELFIKLDNDNLVQLTGDNKGHYAIKEIVELYLSDVSFNSSGLACQYRPWIKGSLAITMDPSKHFGEPLTPSGYTAHALAEAVKTEGTVDRAAIAYGVDRLEVELACGYIDYLRVIPTRE